MHILPGKPVAKAIAEAITKELQGRTSTPTFHCLLVGDDPASRLYISRKEAVAKELGIGFILHVLPTDSTPHAVAAKIAELNHAADGFIVQLPLPEKLRPYTTPLLNRVDPKRDADGLTRSHRQAMLAGKSGAFLPTPIAATLFLLASSDAAHDWLCELPFHTPHQPKLVPQAFKDNHAVVISDGDVFGPTLGEVLERDGLTVAVEHSRSPVLHHELSRADLVITAVGRPGFLKGDYLKTGATVIDVGTTLVEGKTNGDLDWASVEDKNIIATPVPGGVGPVTVAMLYANLLALTKR